MLNVNVINAKNTQKVEVKPGQSAKLKVDPNTRFELVDSASGKAPAQIKARRVGDNLEIVMGEKALIEEEAISNAQKPDLVLENYYKQADVSLYAGAGEEAVSYVPVDGAASSTYAAMGTSATTGAALGVFPLFNPLLGAAAIGAGAIVSANSKSTSNQLPVAQDAAAKATENKVLSEKVPTATDADGTVASYQLVSDVSAGKLTFNTDGSYSFDANKDFDNLAVGQTKTVNFTYSAVDNAGGVSAPKTVTITVTGTNDAPVASAATKSVDEGAKVDGSVTATDADAGATLKYALVGAAPAGLTFKDDGTYSFDASDAAYDTLKSGETQDVLVKFKANDGVVDSAEQTLTIKVKGVNDAATISGTAAGDVTEDATTTTARGSLTVSDVDAGQAKVVAQKDSAGTYGRFSITEAGAWTYSLDNSNTKVQALNADEKVKETFKVKSADGAASQDVTVTISGSNDAPIATFVTNIEISEDAVGYKVQLTATDVDTAATIKYKLVDPAAFDSIGIALSESGQLTVNTSNSKYQELKKDDLIDLEIKYQVEDDKGSASLESAFRLKISGVNDTATITGVSTGDVTEDATSTATGSLTVSDVDADQAKVVAQTDSAGDFGKFSITEAGEWTYELDNELIQSLPEEFFLEDKLIVKSIDGSATQEVVITINGADDRAEITFVKDTNGEDLATVQRPESKDPVAKSANGTLSVGMLDSNDKIIVSGVKFNSEKSSPLTGSGLTEKALEEGFLNSLVLQPIANNGGLHNLAWDFYTGGTVPEDFRLVLDYTLQSVNEGEVEPVSTVVIQVDVTGVNSPVTVSLQQKDKDQVTVMETNDKVDSGIQTLTVNEWDFGTKVNVKVGSAKVNLEKSTFLEASDVTASFEEYIQQWLHMGDFRDLSGVSNLDWNFKTTFKDDLDAVPEGEKMVLDYVLNIYENDRPDPVTTKTIEVTIDGKNDAPIYESLKDEDGEDSSFAKLNVSANSKESAKGTLSPYDSDFIETITHEIKGLEFDAVNSTQGMKEKFDTLNISLKNLLTLDTLDEFSEPHSLTWKFNAKEEDLSLASAGVQAGSVLAMNYVLRVTDIYGAFSEQKIHIELNV